MRSSANAEPAMATTPNSEPKRNSWKGLLLWVLLALFLRWQVIEPRWIPSGSMLPTLQLQDRILVEKITPKLNRQRHRPIGLDQIVVFAVPPQLVEAGYDANAALIKRVVGRPGDTIEVRGGQLLRNNSPVPEGWMPAAMDYDQGPLTVPQGQYWVLGDNRNASLDSHVWGALPGEQVIGTAVWRYWPLNRFGPIRFLHQDSEVPQIAAAIGSHD